MYLVVEIDWHILFTVMAFIEQSGRQRGPPYLGFQFPQAKK
jgi:hypothetical protein